MCPDCLDSAICSDTDGSFQCLCDDGLVPADPDFGLNTACVGIDECADDATNTCEAPAVCHDTDASFECRCSEGYFAASGGNGNAPVVCENINECNQPTIVQAQCDANALCVDTDGSFECQCSDGFGPAPFFPDGHSRSGTAVDHAGQVCIEVSYEDCSVNNGIGPCDDTIVDGSALGICTTVIMPGEVPNADCGCSSHSPYQMLDRSTNKCLSGDMALECGIANVGGTVNIACDTGVISGVKFASWGAPVGTCGDFQAHPVCHRDVTTYVKENCLGQADCSLSAQQSILGDVSGDGCSAASGRLYVEVECNCNGGIADEENGVPNGRCRCPCLDAEKIFSLTIHVKAEILHFTEAFREASSVWSQATSESLSAASVPTSVEFGISGSALGEEVAGDDTTTGNPVSRLDPRQCINTEQAARDSRGYDCWGYFLGSNCGGGYDTSAFTAGEMCCSCGGGLSNYPPSNILAPSGTVMQYKVTLPSPTEREETLTMTVQAGGQEIGTRTYMVSELLAKFDPCGHPAGGRPADTEAVNFELGRVKFEVYSEDNEFVCEAESSTEGKELDSVNFVKICVDSGVACAEELGMAIGAECRNKYCRGPSSAHVAEPGFGGEGAVTTASGIGEAPAVVFASLIDTTKVYPLDGAHPRMMFTTKGQEGDYLSCAHWDIAQVDRTEDVAIDACARAEAEDLTLILACPASPGPLTTYRISAITRASYGSPSTTGVSASNCNEWETGDCNHDVTSGIATLCIGETECSVDFTQDAPLSLPNDGACFDSSATVRRMVVSFQCKPDHEGVPYPRNRIYRAPDLKYGDTGAAFQKCALLPDSWETDDLAEDQAVIQRYILFSASYRADKLQEHQREREAARLLVCTRKTDPNSVPDTEDFRIGKYCPTEESCEAHCRSVGIWRYWVYHTDLNWIPYGCTAIPWAQLCVWNTNVNDLRPAFWHGPRCKPAPGPNDPPSARWYSNDIVVPPQCPLVAKPKDAGTASKWEFERMEEIQGTEDASYTVSSYDCSGPLKLTEFGIDCSVGYSFFDFRYWVCLFIRLGLGHRFCYIRSGIELIKNLNDIGMAGSFSVALDVSFSQFQSVGFEENVVIMTAVTTDPDEVLPMLASDFHTLSSANRGFKEDLRKRRFRLTATRTGGPNMEVGGVKCHPSTDSSNALLEETPYHLVFRFDQDAGTGSIYMKNIRTGEHHIIYCQNTFERSAPGRQDSLFLGMDVTDSGGATDMGLLGDVTHVMLFPFSLSDSASSIVYGPESDAEEKFNLAITGSSVKIIHPPKEPSETCYADDQPQPFAFYKKLRMCTDEDTSNVCYEYYAGHMNDLEPRTSYSVRVSIDERIMVPLGDKAIPFKANQPPKFIALPKSTGASQFRMIGQVWAAGGGAAPGKAYRFSISTIPFRFFTVSLFYAIFYFFPILQAQYMLDGIGLECDPFHITCNQIDECTESRLFTSWYFFFIPLIDWSTHKCGSGHPCFETMGTYMCSVGSGGAYAEALLEVPDDYDYVKVCVGGHGGMGWVENSGTFPLEVEMQGGESHSLCSLEGGNGVEDSSQCGGRTAGGVDFEAATGRCAGGGGGAGSGIAACKFEDGSEEMTGALDKCDWLIIAGGGGGGTFGIGNAGKPGGLPSESIAGSSATVVPGSDGTVPGAGGGGGGAGSFGQGGTSSVSSKGGGSFFHEDMASDTVLRFPNLFDDVAIAGPGVDYDNFNRGGRPRAIRNAQILRPAGDGLVFLELDSSFDSYSEVWAEFKTSCSCIIEPSPGEGEEPFDGVPSVFRVVQGPATFNFFWTDQSLCEHAYQFERNGTALEAEFAFQSDCFEPVETGSGGTGDPLLATDENDEPVFPVGRPVTYCLRAVGPPAGEAAEDPYQSAKTCHTVRVKHVSVVHGKVTTMADTNVGIPNVMVTTYILTSDEHSAIESFQDDPKIHAWDFVDPDKEDFEVIFEQAQGVRRQRRTTIRRCPAIEAEDETGLPLYTSFDETYAGSIANATCPAIGNEIPASVSYVFRSCSTSGSWLAVDGACPDPLAYFTPPAQKFIRATNLDITATLSVLENTDERTCAWVCLTQSASCVSFEIFRSGLQPRCYLSEFTSNDDGIEFIVPKFGNMEYRELENIDMKAAITINSYSHPVDTGRSCSMDELALQFQWPTDPGSVGPYLSTNEHLQQFESRACNHVHGSLVVRCEDTCALRVTSVWKMFGVATPSTSEIAQLCPRFVEMPSMEELYSKVRGACATYSSLSQDRCQAAESSLSPLQPDDDHRISSLVSLHHVETVTGIVEITGCNDLVRFDGGLGNLRKISGVVHGLGPIDIRRNLQLTGSLSRMLPNLPKGRLHLGNVSDNPQLCVSVDESRFQHDNNADDAECGCVQADSPNYDPTKLFDDGSCDTVQCVDCVPGTHGRCTFQRGGETICVPMANNTLTGELECLSGNVYGNECVGLTCLQGYTPSLCDLCSAITICDTPPNCRSNVGACDEKTGRCSYPTLLSAGSSCTDENIFTGPDVCTAEGQCITSQKCIISEILDVYNQEDEYGLSITTQTRLNLLRGCGTISGNLNINCGAVTTDPITSFDQLVSIARIMGLLRIVDCDISSLSMPNLRMVGGGLGGFGLILEDNGFVGTPDTLFPALMSVDGGAELRRNPSLCTNTFDWFDAVELSNNAPVASCGCTDSSALNYDVLRLIDDGSCEYPPCAEDCVDDDENDCKISVCNAKTGFCEIIDKIDSQAGEAAAEVSCNDSNPYTSNDTCIVLNGVIDCIGSHVCNDNYRGTYCNMSTRHQIEGGSTVDSRPGDEQCTFLLVSLGIMLAGLKPSQAVSY